MGGVEFSAIDQRSYQIPIPASQSQVAELGDLLSQAARDGYTLEGGASIEGGHQRDPHTIGLRLILKRNPR